ncbi:GDP-L-fucose synthase [Acetomicrobium sp.]|jgi:GDP-L-fucose synthase|uniref:GDP-L-fucose synthase n=1 Tax=Acetomicrobium sp. TaxID=1872099 RepID=UPI003D96B526
MEKNSKIFVAGHRGLVGSAIVRKLKNEGYDNLVLKTRQELDLRDKKAVESFFKTEQPEYVFLAAAKVGGIQANNTYPADFIIQNIEIETNVITSALQVGVKRLLFLGSSCIYPRECPQPIKEEYLLTGQLEPTNEPYAIAKIAGIKMCESINRQHGTDFRSLMPTNLYGPGDNFHPENSHVIPGLLRRFHEAKVRGDKYVNVWGSGRPRREFMHVDDLASACVYIMNLDKDIYDNFTQPMLSHVNVGVGKDCSIKELAETIAEVVGFYGEICFDTSKPDGTPQKLLDISRISALGWSAKISLEEGLKHTYQWFLENKESLRVH